MLQDQNSINNPKIIKNLWATKQRKIFELYLNKISSPTGKYINKINNYIFIII